LALFTIARSWQSDNAENTRTHPFRDGFDRSSLAGGIAPLKYENDSRSFRLDPVLKSAQLDLKFL